MKMKFAVTMAAAALAVLTQVAPAEAHHRSWHRNGGAVAAGVAAGIIGGALIAGATRPAYGSPVVVDPGYGYAPPPRRVYAEPQYEEVVTCRTVRQPLRDDYGRIVAYRQRRVCN